jgi:hypothetical protein
MTFFEFTGALIAQRPALQELHQLSLTGRVADDQVVAGALLYVNEPIKADCPIYHIRLGQPCAGHELLEIIRSARDKSDCDSLSDLLTGRLGPGSGHGSLLGRIGCHGQYPPAGWPESPACHASGQLRYPYAQIRPKYRYQLLTACKLVIGYT